MDGIRSTNFQFVQNKPNFQGLSDDSKGEEESESEAQQDHYSDSLADVDELDEQEEQAEGSRHEEELLEKYDLWEDEETEILLDELFEELEQHMGRELEYDFLALDTDQPFASSCPNGAIYFTRSLLQNLERAEVLFFAAHELAHTELRHYATRKRRLGDLRHAITAPLGSPTRQRFDQAAVLTVRHQEEFEADFQAGIWVGHALGAQALSTLHHLCQNLSPESLNRPTHPPFEKRVRNLKEKRPFSESLSYLYSLLQ